MIITQDEFLSLLSKALGKTVIGVSYLPKITSMDIHFEETANVIVRSDAAVARGNLADDEIVISYSE